MVHSTPVCQLLAAFPMSKAPDIWSRSGAGVVRDFY